MRPIGFSTGALAFGDFQKPLVMLGDTACDAIELSALRDHELIPLMEALKKLDLRKFKYRSVHVPSKFTTLTEAAVAAALRPCIELELPIVIHPDVIEQPASWDGFGALLCLENMDRRKRTGRTVAELEGFFARFPEATFCLDIAHAHQIDSTMAETRRMLRRFGNRLRQVHISEINFAGHHGPVSLAIILASQGVARLIGEDVPIIIESVVPASAIPGEIEAVQRALRMPASESEFEDWGALA